MLELKLAIHHRTASLSSQASYAVLAEESLTRLCSNTETTTAMDNKDIFECGCPRTTLVYVFEQRCLLTTTTRDILKLSTARGSCSKT